MSVWILLFACWNDKEVLVLLGRVLGSTTSPEQSHVMSFIIVVWSLSHIFATPWTVAHQAPLSMKFSRQEYQSGLPFPPPGDLPHPGINPSFPALQADSLPLSHQRSPARMLAGRGVRNEGRSAFAKRMVLEGLLPEKLAVRG